MNRHSFRWTATLLMIGLFLVAESQSQAGTLVSFATPVVTGPQAPGVWYVDRYAPAGFSSPVAAGGRTNTLKETISSADQMGSRPAGFNTAFYNTQGRAYDLPGGTTSLFVDLYVPSVWNSLNQVTLDTTGRLASLWGVGRDAGNAVVSYPIIEFNNNIDGAGTDGFRTWNNTTGTWDNVAGFAGYDQWYQIGFDDANGTLTYYVNGAPVSAYSDAANQYDHLGSAILQGYNGGNTYDINWDNLSTSAVPEPTSIAVFATMALGGAFLWLASSQAELTSLAIPGIGGSGGEFATWDVTNTRTCPHLGSRNKIGDMLTHYVDMAWLK